MGRYSCWCEGEWEFDFMSGLCIIVDREILLLCFYFFLEFCKCGDLDNKYLDNEYFLFFFY